MGRGLGPGDCSRGSIGDGTPTREGTQWLSVWPRGQGENVELWSNAVSKTNHFLQPLDKILGFLIVCIELND